MDNKRIKLQRALIYTFFISINLFLVGFFGVPKIQAINVMDKTTEANEVLAKKLEQDKLTVQSLKKKIDLLAEKISGTDVKVPENLDTSKLVYDFYIFAGVKEVDAVHIAFEELPEDVSDKENTKGNEISASGIHITFNFEGIAYNVVSFIEDADKIADENLLVDSIRLVDAGEGRLQAEIGLITYIRNPLPPDSKYESYEFHLENIGYDDIASMFGE